MKNPFKQLTNRDYFFFNIGATYMISNYADYSCMQEQLYAIYKGWT